MENLPVRDADGQARDESGDSRVNGLGDDPELVEVEHYAEDGGINVCNGRRLLRSVASTRPDLYKHAAVKASRS